MVNTHWITGTLTLKWLRQETLIEGVVEEEEDVEEVEEKVVSKCSSEA